MQGKEILDVYCTCAGHVSGGPSSTGPSEPSRGSLYWQTRGAVALWGRPQPCQMLPSETGPSWLSRETQSCQTSETCQQQAPSACCQRDAIAASGGDFGLPQVLLALILKSTDASMRDKTWVAKQSSPKPADLRVTNGGPFCQLSSRRFRCTRRRKVAQKKKIFRSFEDSRQSQLADIIISRACARMGLANMREQRGPWPANSCSRLRCAQKVAPAAVALPSKTVGITMRFGQPPKY